MGNQHSYSNYNCQNSWEVESSNARHRRHPNKRSRTHADFGGAISRLVGNNIAKEARKAYKQVFHNEKKKAPPSPNVLENLYGSDYRQYINPNQLQRSASAIPSQNQTVRSNQQRTRTAVPLTSVEVRRPDFNINYQEGDLQAICVYCNDTIVPEFYEYHLEQCKQNPQNMKKACDFCGNLFEPNTIQYHMRECEAKVENLKIPCDYCKKSIPLAEHNYHLSTCSLNPKNLSHAKSKKMNNSQLAVSQVQECAICLLEMKKDSSLRFLGCAHKFHTTCIEDWSKKKKTCPVCVTTFE